MTTVSARTELAENWPVVAIAFVLVFFAFGIPTFSMPWMYGPAMEEFGWSRAEVNLLSSAKFSIGAIAALGMGILIDRIGGRWTVLVGCMAGGLALFMFWFATSLHIYYLAGAVLGFSASSITTAMKVIVSRLFSIGQGTAIGIVLTATSLAGIVMPLLWPQLLQHYNWREICAMMSAGPLLIATPAWLLFVTFTKESLRHEIVRPSVIKGQATTWQHFRKISSNRDFWLVAGGLFIVSAVDQSLMQNYVLFLREDKGMDPQTTISYAGMLLGVLAFASKIGSGWIFDRYSIRGIAVFYFLLGLSLLLGLPVSGTFTLLAFIVVRAVAHGGMIVDIPILTKHCYGMERLGMTMGVLSVFVNLGFMVGPPLFGHMADRFGSFTPGLIAYAAFATLAGFMLLPVVPKFWVAPGKRAGQQTGQESQVS